MLGSGHFACASGFELKWDNFCRSRNRIPKTASDSQQSLIALARAQGSVTLSRDKNEVVRPRVE